MDKKRRLAFCLAFLVLFSMIHVIADSSIHRDEFVKYEQSVSNFLDEEQKTDSESQLVKMSYPDVLTDDEKSNSYIARKYEEERSLYDLVFENEDHTRTAYFYPSPVKYSTAEGTMRDKSTAIFQVNSENSVIPLSKTSTLSSKQAVASLQELSNKGETVSRIAYASLDNDVKTYYSQDIEDGLIVSKDTWLFKLFPLLDKANDSTKFTALVSMDSSAVNRIEYHQPNQNDLVIRYVPTLNGIKEEIVLLSPSNQTEYSFRIECSNCRIWQKDQIVYLIEGESNQTLGQFEQIVSFDMNGKQSVGTMLFQAGADDSEGILTIRIDSSFLQDATYPVVIDPSFNVWYRYDGYLDIFQEVGVYEGTNAWNCTFDYYHYVGMNPIDSTVTGRVLYRFPLFTSSYYGFHSFYPDQINSCQLHMRTYGVSQLCSLFTVPCNQSTWVAGTRICNSSLYHDVSYSYTEFSSKNNDCSMITADITQKCKLWMSYMRGLTSDTFANPNCGIMVICMSEDEEGCGIQGVTGYNYNAPMETYLSIDYSLSSYMGDFYINNIGSRAFLNTTSSYYSLLPSKGVMSELSNTVKWTSELVEDGSVKKYAIHPYGRSDRFLYHDGTLTQTYSLYCLWRYEKDSNGVAIVNDATGKYLYEDEGFSSIYSLINDQGEACRWRFARTNEYQELSLSNLTIETLYGQKGIPQNVMNKLVTYNISFAETEDFLLIPTYSSRATGGTTGYLTGLKEIDSQFVEILHIPTGISKLFTFYTTISDGIYYVKNVAAGTYLQPDDADAPDYSTDNLDMEGWPFNGEIYQKWEFDYLGDGYFKILSQKSGKALSIKSGYEDSSTQPLVQSTYQFGSINQLWRIDWNTNGFVIRPKTGEYYSSDWCMSYDNYSLNPTGIKIVQNGYTNNINHQDEWYILKSDNSFFQTTLFNESPISTSVFHRDVELYYNKARVRGTLYSSISESELISQIHTNNYVCLITHGGEYENKLKVTNNEVLFLSELSYLTSSDFENVELIVLPCCYSGRSGGFVDYFLAKGIDVVIGFDGSIEQETTLFWTNRFLYYVTQGNTVQYSLLNANYDLAIQYNGIYYQQVVNTLVGCIEYGTSAIGTVIFQ